MGKAMIASTTVTTAATVTVRRTIVA